MRRPRSLQPRPRPLCTAQAWWRVLPYTPPISPLYLAYISPGLVEGSAAVATAGLQLHYEGGGTREVLVTVHADVYAEVGL